MSRFLEGPKRYPIDMYGGPNPDDRSTYTRPFIEKLPGPLDGWKLYFHNNQRQAIGLGEGELEKGQTRTVLTLPNATNTVSRRHCTLFVRQGKLYVEDHSTNGTRVIQSSAPHEQDGIVLYAAEMELQGGEFLRLGGLESETLLRVMKAKQENEAVFPVVLVQAVYLTDTVLQSDRW